MERFFIILTALLVLGMLAGGCVGLYYLIDSRAVEDSVKRVGGAISDGLSLLGEGLFYVLIALAISIVFIGFGWGLRAGAEPLGHLIINIASAPKIANAIEHGQSPQLPVPDTIGQPGLNFEWVEDKPKYLEKLK